MKNLKTLNTQKTTIMIANVALMFCAAYVIAVLLTFKQTQLQLATPLIDQKVTCEIFAYYVDGGLIMAMALFIMLIFRFLRQNVIVILIGVLTSTAQQLYFPWN